MREQTIRTAIVGASGYTGAELLRLVANHPNIELVAATGDSMAGRRVGDLYPSLHTAYPDLVFTEFDADALSGLDLVFLGLPHAASMELAPQIVGEVGCVVDLSAAYRLSDASHYPTFYGFEHTQPELLAEAVFGLPELHRDLLTGARLVATPGCHVTAATLALRPLVEAGLVENTGVIVNNVTGITGAGRTPTETNVFTNIDSNVVAYGLLHHRHTPEIEQEVGAQVLFTPHLVPMSRGILATCYATPAADCSAERLVGAMRTFYDGEPFVSVLDGPPATKSVLGSNAAHVWATLDERTGRVITMCSIDNLTKGASGGALQAANVALGLDETAGLTMVGVAP
ncbi:N-acetyl-gamma-glutamyl-phosphate reductase [Ilumatobacter coccineus]|uniref:N-acetyl-gamma-glutamyl-phosphate reductase n=1 Tax=Ilumatobacter coccineus (strain NBRC 103263 / KCTC 29153 / YM16-304) TaxID=1313172 RepID=A0A6C7E7P7_ILUCY|nr:N-acetyl-gamma-glutamyl-phosphate reductase [Ilumatobacter coccineus]BAN02393.1 N-acetyl-gamma-glutamyl-phosphate reductase [Ilumatobacter coccineus YM16-304]